MSAVLPGFSEALADAVSTASAGLVRVEGRERLPATGIVWDAAGLIVTAHHVLERDENINIGYQDGETVAAELVGRDPTTDLALLRTSKQGQEAAAGSRETRIDPGPDYHRNFRRINGSRQFDKIRTRPRGLPTGPHSFYRLESLRC